MLYYKCYPSRDDYKNVGCTIVQKYPFMKSPVGSPAVGYKGNISITHFLFDNCFASETVAPIINCSILFSQIQGAIIVSLQILSGSSGGTRPSGGRDLQYHKFLIQRSLDQQAPLFCYPSHQFQQVWMYLHNIHVPHVLTVCNYIGEDEVSFARHTKVLQAENRKQRPNQQIVEELMSLTFAMRRADILRNTYDLSTLFAKYPFLNGSGQVCCLLIWTY